jgi:hypothetical protein
MKHVKTFTKFNESIESNSNDLTINGKKISQADFDKLVSMIGGINESRLVESKSIIAALVMSFLMSNPAAASTLANGDVQGVYQMISKDSNSSFVVDSTVDTPSTNARAINLKEITDQIGFPESQKNLGKEGTVKISVNVVNGEVTDIKNIFSTNEEFMSAVEEYIYDLKFSSSTSTWVNLTFNFKLK